MAFFALMYLAIQLEIPKVAAVYGPIIGAIMLGLAARKVLRPLARSIPARIETVADVARLAAANLKDGQWTRNEVAHGLRLIVLEVLGPPAEKYHEDADVVKDLGLS